MRNNYWSCTEFARWCQKVAGAPTKPYCGTSEEWDEWHVAYKSSCPFTHWFTETALGKIQDIVYWPYDVCEDVRVYLRNRFITRTHVAVSDLKKGQWHETEERLLHCTFGLLVDYVESECAYHHLACANKDDPVHKEAPWYRRSKWFDWTRFHSPALGLRYLEWECSLVDEDAEGNMVKTRQALQAEEIRALYVWWKETRPARPDPYDEGGFTDWMEGKGNSVIQILSHAGSDSNDVKTILDRVDDLRKQYEKEDEEMLIRLVRARASLWT